MDIDSTMSVNKSCKNMQVNIQQPINVNLMNIDSAMSKCAKKLKLYLQFMEYL